MVERLKVKFIVVIWGARYIREFARVSMPSHLAPGNLPHLAAETDLEVIVMTTTAGREEFDKQPIFARLRALCPVRYIFIDDLVTTGVYGVTLTLAYARGIRDSGPAQTNTYFIFMNSDFVLADGSLRTLEGRFKDGHRCVMAPSLRACSETAFPMLLDDVDQVDHTLTMAPRQMVRLALENLHPTVVAKTVSQEFITCSTHNQIYWQVDDKTLLVHHYLIFQLAIKPEVLLGAINSYSDYGLVPELVPSGQFTVLDDSDEFFMLELQSTAQEKEMLRCGTNTQREIAAELSRWSTCEHRRFAEVDIVFHSDDLPPGFEQAKRDLADYMTALDGRMRQPPLSHVDHFYWLTGLEAWIARKYPDETELPNLPPELFPPVDYVVAEKPMEPLFALRRQSRKSLGKYYISLVGHVRRSVGIPPDVAIWHHTWLDCQHLRNWVSAVTGAEHSRNLLVCDSSSPLQDSLPKLAPFDVRVAIDNADAAEDFVQDQQLPELCYDNVLVHLHRWNVRKMQAILEDPGLRVRIGGTIAIYIDHPNGEMDTSNFSYELAHYVDEMLPSDWIGYRVKASFAGGKAKRYLRRTERLLFRFLWPSSALRVPLLALPAVFWPIVAALTTVNNLLGRRLSSRCPTFCSSALLSLTRVSAQERSTRRRRVEQVVSARALTVEGRHIAAELAAGDGD